MRRADLTNWALITSPKFTTGVQYQIHQGFWPHQRSGNPNHNSPLYIYWVIGISGSLIWSKTLMELIFNPSGEFRQTSEGPVSPSSPPRWCPWVFSDLLSSVQMLKREWGAENNEKLPHLFISSKTATLVPEFTVEDLLWAELQPCFLSLQWKTCSREKQHDDIRTAHKKSY